MNFLITMAGQGTRFLNGGYQRPKWLIHAKGKSLLQWSVDSLPLDLCSKMIFVILRDHETEYNTSNFISEIYGDYNLQFVFLDEPTRGQAETAFRAKHLISNSESLLIYNIDTKFNSSTLKTSLLNPDIDGVLGAFKSTSPKFSFAKLDKNRMFITEVTEKIPISDNALTGLYHFSRAELFFTVAEQAIKKENLTHGEFFIAPLYNQLIAEGYKFILDFSNSFDVLGTPAELELFIRKKV